MVDHGRLIDAATILLEGALSVNNNGSPGTVGGSARVIDLGPMLEKRQADDTSSGGAAGLRGDVALDVSDLTLGAGVTYLVRLQGSDTSDFTIATTVAGKILHGAGSQFGDTNASSPGRYTIPFVTEQNGLRYRYLRLWVEFISPGDITLTASLTVT